MKKLLFIFCALFLITGTSFGQGTKRVDSTAFVSPSAVKSVVVINQGGATRQLDPETLRKMDAAKIVAVVGTLPSSGNGSYKGYFARESNGSRITSYVDTLGNRWAIGADVDLSAYLTSAAAATTYATNASVDTAKANIRAESASNINYEYLERRRVDDSLRNAVNTKANQSALDSINRDFWKLSGNGFFANQVYKFGVNSGVNIGASTTPNYFDAANKIMFGLNLNNADDYSADRAILTLQANMFDVRAKNGSNQFWNTLTNNQVQATWYENGIQNGYSVVYNTYGSVMLQLYGKRVSNTSGFVSKIVVSEKTAFLTAQSGVLSNTYENGDLILNKESQRIYVKNDGIAKEVAFTTEVIRKAITIPTSTSDVTGNVGDEISDANWKYVKTPAGWKRFALSTF